MTPKTVSRLVRFKRLRGQLIPAPSLSWAERALDTGYFDQAI